MEKRILVDLIDPIKEARFGVKQVERKKEPPVSGYRIPSQHAEKYISKLQAFRGFKVLGLKSEGNTKVAIDLFSGKVINLGGKGVESRITNSVQLYESKSAALSEKFPPNQVGASKAGNGTLPRILVSFDGWGFSKRCYGGIPSYQFEYVRFVRIVDCLDPPTIPKRFCEVTAHPYYFAKKDNCKPQRQRSTRLIKAERMLSKP
jgi:hypothetical protein